MAGSTNLITNLVDRLFTEATENARRELTQDDWFVKEEPYVIEIISTPDPLGTNGGLLTGSIVFVLPLTPEAIQLQRVFRQSVTPTLGGLVAEENGLLWRVLEISGTFGLEPKCSYDTSILENALGTAQAFSGPAWTRRLTTILEKYGELKANPVFAAATSMVYHNMKEDQHWVIVPELFATNRTVQRRQQYPYNFRFKTVGDADAITLPETTSSLLDKIRNAISDIAAAQRQISSAIQEGSQILGEVRYFAATIDSLIDNMTNIVNSMTDFVDGATDTLSIGATFIKSTAALMDATLLLMETADALPDEVRQNYQEAADGLDAAAAALGAFGTTYDSEASTVAAQEKGAARATSEELASAKSAGAPNTSTELANNSTRSTDSALLDAGDLGEGGRIFGTYNGFFEYSVSAADTIQSIASRFLRDGALWYDIAIANGLSAPYISESGVPNTVKPGDVISIPTNAAQTPTAIISDGQGSEPGLDLLGTDFLLTETDNSKPGRPEVDFVIDQRTKKDFKFTSDGTSNLGQALQMRMWTDKGTLPHAPSYGRGRLVGFGTTSADLATLQLRARETLLADPRVVSLRNFKFTVNRDAAEIDVDVVPVGASSARTIAVSVT